LRPAGSIDAYVVSPAGCYAGGPTFLCFCQGICGLVVWGDPQPEHAAEVLRALEADLRLRPHGYFIDARRLGATPSPEAFQLVLSHLLPRWEQYQGVIERCAIVLPPGMAGAVVAGFFSLASPPFPVRFFADPVAALEWLGSSAAVMAEIDSAQHAVGGADPFLFRLRAHLDDRLAAATPRGAAKELGVSGRSLQRRLQDANTTFTNELNAARVRKAQRLLAGSDIKVTGIALEVGCASSQHFSQLFRKLTGETPSAWRTTHRSAN
jgi:AraC-like DNA-binding protein